MEIYKFHVVLTVYYILQNNDNMSNVEIFQNTLQPRLSKPIVNPLLMSG
jgi:hypothetical protein